MVTASGGALDLYGQTIANNLTLNGTGASGSIGALTNSSVLGATVNGTVYLQTASSIGGAGNITLSNTVSGGD